VAGGLTGAGVDNTPLVERAEVALDGTLSAWVTVTALPDKRSHNAIVAYDDALWVSGGLSGDPAGVHTSYKDVLRAEILADGSLGAWNTVGELPLTLATHSSFAHGGALYVVGGVEDGDTNTAAVRRALIEENGMLASWEDLPPLPKPRAHAHQTPVFGGFVYSAGGAFEHASIPDVFIGRFE
jgi:N-acetylneuraminic acid mutarotase